MGLLLIEVQDLYRSITRTCDTIAERMLFICDEVSSVHPEILVMKNTYKPFLRRFLEGRNFRIQQIDNVSLIDGICLVDKIISIKTDLLTELDLFQQFVTRLLERHRLELALLEERKALLDIRSALLVERAVLQREATVSTLPFNITALAD